ncbi:MAG: hypothetical protein ACRBN8_10130 [Nannocystales bacterium]
MKRCGWLLAGVWLGCASGDEPATSAATTFAPMSSGSATATTATPTTATSTTASDSTGGSGDTELPTETAESTGETSAEASTDTDPLGSSGGESTFGEPPSEQPEDGMYSSCASIVDCIGLTACLTATDTGGQPIDPFCTAGACKSPLAQCDPTPGGTAVPICLPTKTESGMDTVCALDCSQGQECPDGMDCRTLAAGSICS